MCSWLSHTHTSCKFYLLVREYENTKRHACIAPFCRQTSLFKWAANKVVDGLMGVESVTISLPEEGSCCCGSHAWKVIGPPSLSSSGGGMEIQLPICWLQLGWVG